MKTVSDCHGCDENKLNVSQNWENSVHCSYDSLITASDAGQSVSPSPPWLECCESCEAQGQRYRRLLDLSAVMHIIALLSFN